ncbi:hypothetical protein [Tropicimonas sp. S265A]|uniref:hypothetical protein n=1 Tax=Tropicimonas sp. S265A TaxID=3415134 RepID=UPI003C7E76C8
MAGRSYRKGKRGAGRHVQLPEYLQATEAWETLKPGPRALYIELKRRYNGRNNGQIFLSHRDAAKAINVNRNTVGGYFAELQQRGFISMTRAPYLGPEGVGRASLWALQELATHDSKPAEHGFKKWRKNKKPRTKSMRSRPDNQDTDTEWDDGKRAPVLKIVT